MGAKPKLSPEEWKQLVEFYALGHTYMECAKRFGVSRLTIVNHFKKHPELPRRRPFEKARESKANNPEIAKPVVQSAEKTPPRSASGKRRKVVPIGELNG